MHEIIPNAKRITQAELAVEGLIKVYKNHERKAKFVETILANKEVDLVHLVNFLDAIASELMKEIQRLEQGEES